jgi:hypothetical protein
MGESTALSAIRVWNTGSAEYFDKDLKAKPITPSGGNWGLSKPVEYWSAAPNTWLFAYGEKCERFVGKERKP